MRGCELTVRDEFKLMEKTMLTSYFNGRAILKAAVLVAPMLLFGVSASFGQQTINLSAAPATTTLPDGTTVPLGGYFLGTAAPPPPPPSPPLNPLPHPIPPPPHP